MAEVNSQPKTRQPKSGIIIPHAPKWHQRLGSFGVVHFITRVVAHRALPHGGAFGIFFAVRTGARDFLYLAQPAGDMRQGFGRSPAAA